MLIKLKYMVMSRDRNAGQGHSVKIDNTSIERVEEGVKGRPGLRGYTDADM